MTFTGAQSHRLPHKGRPTVNRVFQYDPTRTTTLRSQWVRDADKRWNRLIRDVRKSIVDNDCFGFQPQVVPIVFDVLQPLPRKVFQFKTDPEKAQGFMSWLAREEDKGVLETIVRPGRVGTHPWTDVYVDTAYQKGIRRARAELIRAGYDVPPIEGVPGGIGAVMNGPVHADRIGLLYTRTFEDLKSVTSVANAQTRRIVSDSLRTGIALGIAEGKNPRRIARELFGDVKNRLSAIGKTRTRMIARTEVIRAHNAALIAEYEQADADMDVSVLAEWSTAGFNVCPICTDLQLRGPYKLKEIEGMIPAHPNCRCIAIPVVRSADKGRETTTPTTPIESERPRGRPTPPRSKPKIDITDWEEDDWFEHFGQDDLNWLPWFEDEDNAIMRAVQYMNKSDAIEKFGADTYNKYRAMVDKMDDVLDQIKPHEGTVYRGIKNIDDEVYKKFVTSDEIMWDSMSSAADNADGGLFWLSDLEGTGAKNQILFRVENKTGINIQSLGGEAFEEEAEVVLRRGARYRVKNVSKITKEITDNVDDYKDVTVIDLEEII